MSDLNKKSQDINNLTDEIESKSGEIDNEIGVLEIKRKEMDDLGDKSESILDNLSGIEGEALEIAQAKITQELEVKANEIEESERKIQEIGEELNEKKAEIESGIEDYNSAIEEIGVAEKECDVDLSDCRDAASSDRDELVEASNKIDEILGKIDSALAGNGDSAKKKPNDAFSKGVSSFVLGVQIASGLLGGVAEGKTPDIARMGLQGGSDIVNEMGTRASSANEDEIKRRRREAENVSIADNQPKTSR